MIYKDVPQHGTNIIQLILNYVSDGNRILPGQDLFENIVAFNERLVYSPSTTPQRPASSASRNLSKQSIYKFSTPHRSVNKASTSRNPSKLSIFKFSTPHHPVNKGSTSLTYSPISSRTSGQHAYQDNSRWRY